MAPPTAPGRLGPAAMRAAAAAARQAEGREAGLELLGRATAVPRLAAEAWAHLARLHRDDGDTAQALHLFARALAAGEAGGTVPAWATPEYARLLRGSGRGEEALTLLRGLARGGTASAAALTELVRAVLEADAPEPELDAWLRAGIRRHPHDRALVEEWIDLLEATGADVAPALAGLQEQADAPLTGVMLTLAERFADACAAPALGARLAALAEREPFVSVAATWAAFCGGPAVTAEVAASVAQSPLPLLTFFFRCLRPPAAQIPLLGDAGASAAAAAGVRLDAMGAFLATFLRPATAAWETRLRQVPRDDPRTRAAMLRPEHHLGYLDRIALEGTLRMADPLTGAVVEPFDSVIAFGRPVYSFEGQERFLMICSRPRSTAAGLYIPGRNLWLPFFDAVRPAMTGRLPGLLAVVLRRFAGRVAVGAAGVPAPHPGRRRLVLSVGRTENFANHVWDFYSGLDRMAQSGALARIDCVQFGGTEFFGPLETLFPELATIGLERVDAAGIVDPVPFQADSLLLPAGGQFVTRELIGRIVTAMRGLPRRCPPGQDPSDHPRRGMDGPVIWIGLRLRDKAWHDQATACPRLIARLSSRFPRALFLLDGFSFPVGLDTASASWRDTIAELAAVATIIRAACPDPDRVVSMVGNTMRESVLWAQEVDIYLAPYGSTQHKIGWFTPAPGIVYMPPSITPAEAAVSPACTVSEIAAVPEFVIGQPVSPGLRRGIYRRRVDFANVTLDVDGIADRMIALLDARQRDA